MTALSLDALSLALAIADVEGISADYVRVGVDAVYRDAAARPIIVIDPDGTGLADRITARLTERGYAVASRPSAVGDGVDLTVSVPASTAAYDHDAQHARDLALHGFLDLNLDQWERWLHSPGSVEVPSDLEPFAVSVIVNLGKTGVDPDARGNYLQAVASLSTSALQYFIARVGQY